MRQPLPRFTALNAKERAQVCRFFTEWAKVAVHVLRPGGHVFIACNSFMCQMVIRRACRRRSGVSRAANPPGANAARRRPAKECGEEFPDVCSLPRGCYEPWGILRKPLPAGMKVSDCLRQFETGGLRRLPEGLPFSDLVEVGTHSTRGTQTCGASKLETPSAITRAGLCVLPLGKESCLIVHGSGSTVAAATPVACVALGWIKRQRVF